MKEREKKKKRGEIKEREKRRERGKKEERRREGGADGRGEFFLW